jgi:hypothetical protein
MTTSSSLQDYIRQLERTNDELSLLVRELIQQLREARATSTSVNIKSTIDTKSDSEQKTPREASVCLACSQEQDQLFKCLYGDCQKHICDECKAKVSKSVCVTCHGWICPDHVKELLPDGLSCLQCQRTARKLSKL